MHYHEYTISMINQPPTIESHYDSFLLHQQRSYKCLLPSTSPLRHLKYKATNSRHSPTYLHLGSDQVFIFIFISIIDAMYCQPSRYIPRRNMQIRSVSCHACQTRHIMRRTRFERGGRWFVCVCAVLVLQCGGKQLLVGRWLLVGCSRGGLWV